MDDREKLRQHFQNQPAEAHTGRWDAMWQQKVTPWDRSEPNPALIDALNEKSDILGSSTEGGDANRRKKALVPGCGRGYDVLLLASHGYDAYGLDVSQTAIDACRELNIHQGDDDTTYPVKDAQIGRGSRNFLLADFFQDDLSSLTGGGSFDGLHPSMRYPSRVATTMVEANERVIGTWWKPDLPRIPSGQIPESRRAAAWTEQ